ncbi:hypothetical protein MMC29_004382 [Sticta canariensis]|nr:hypothetical protein [Sticta canariensis]
MASSSLNSYVSNLISEISEAAKALPGDPFQDDQARKTLQALSQKLAGALETPMDTIRKMNYAPQSLAICRVAIKGGWFKVLADGDNPKTATELANATGAERELIVRLFRILAAVGIVAEVGRETYSSTPVTNALTHPPIYSAVEHFSCEVLRSFLELPEYLVQNNYRMPSEPSKTPFVDIYGKGIFDHFKDSPARGSNFNVFMEGHQEGKRNWLDIYPLQDRLASDLDEEENAVLLVDIGGGLGHDLRDFGNRRGSMPGRLVLQDLPAIISEVDSSKKPEVEAMAYDYYTPQPIEGARIYYFRAVFHSWNDEICQKILKNQMSAMRKGYSRLLINEMVLHDSEVPLYAAAADVQMMVILGGIERTETQWRQLLDSVGLKIVDIWVMEEGADSIIEADFRD